MASEYETPCRQCQRKLLNWAVINKSGEFVRFLTCPVYCDKQCHMCGETLSITNSRHFTRTVVCGSCAWTDTTAAEPYYQPFVTKKSSPPVTSRLASALQQDDSSYERLTIEEMHKKNIQRAVDPRNNNCGSCGVSISTNGMCRCS